MSKERAGVGVLAVLLAVTGPTVAELTTPNPIVEKGDMASQKEIDLTGQKEIEAVNQRFGEFLAGKGEYSDNKIGQKLMSQVGNYRDLGYYGSGDGYFFRVQALLLNCEEGERGQYLALGVKDKEGERKIVVVEWSTVLLEKVEGGFGVGVKDWGKISGLHINTNEEAKELLKERIGKLLIGNFVYDSSINRYLDEKRVNETNYIKYLESKKSISLDFLAGLLFPDKKTMGTGDKNIIDKIKKIKSKVIEINNFSEMQERIKNLELLPVMNGFTYNLNEK